MFQVKGQRQVLFQTWLTNREENTELHTRRQKFKKSSFNLGYNII